MVSVPEEEERKRIMKQEWRAMQTNGFENASEIFRRRSERTDGGDMSARARKQQQFRSAIFDNPQEKAAPQRVSKTPRESGRNSESSRSTPSINNTRPMTARARLQHITMSKRRACTERQGEAQAAHRSSGDQDSSSNGKSTSAYDGQWTPCFFTYKTNYSSNHRLR